MLENLYFERWLWDDRAVDMNAAHRNPFPKHFIDFDDRRDWLQSMLSIAYKATHTIETHTRDFRASFAPPDNIKPFLEEMVVVGFHSAGIKRVLADIGFMDRDDRVAHYFKEPVLRLFDKYYHLGLLEDIIEYFDRFCRDERDPSIRDCLIAEDTEAKPPPRHGRADPAQMIAVLEVDGKPERIVDSHQRFEVQFWHRPIFKVAGGDPAIHGYDKFLEVQTKDEKVPLHSDKKPSPNFRPVTFRPFDWDSREDLQLLRDYRNKTRQKEENCNE